MVLLPAEIALSRLRVLHVIQNLNYGGMERLFADIVRLLDPAAFENHVLVLGYLGRFAEGLERYATLHQAPPMGRLSMLRPTALTRQIASIAPDVMHTHAGVWHKATLAARHAGVRRLVHTEHGRESPDPWLARAIGWQASRRTDVVVAVSAVLAAHLRARVIGSGVRLEVVMNGVDTVLHAPRPDPGVVRAELGLGPEIPILGSIGRLEPIKGYDVLVSAYAELRRQWRDGPVPVLVVAGDGSERQALGALARAEGVAEGVRLLGWRDDTANLLASFSLFTMGSRSEGTSVSLLEAMSSGLCPVVTRVGGNADVLGTGLAHRLVPSEQPAAMAAAWIGALQNPARLTADRALARGRVQEAFSLDAMVRGYADLYHGC